MGANGRPATQTETARQLVLDYGGHYLLTVKDNQPMLRATNDRLVPVPRTGFSPSAGNGDAGAHGGNEQGGAGEQAGNMGPGGKGCGLSLCGAGAPA